MKAVRKTDATEDDIEQAVADALAVRQVATEIMARHARAHLGEVLSDADSKQTEQTDRIRVLVSIGAAFGVNCVASLERHLAEAKSAGISQDEIAKIVKLAAFIKKRAASHVERLVGMTEEAAA
jgi:alkylhydroperoxidase/carboxymuconolactone decarboxylase family protein YurZ